jgi:hypothetical protein
VVPQVIIRVTYFWQGFSCRKIERSWKEIEKGDDKRRKKRQKRGKEKEEEREDDKIEIISEI